MAELTIISKKHSRTKEPLVISSETWDEMLANGQARYFRVLNTTADPATEKEREERVVRLTKSVNTTVDKQPEVIVTKRTTKKQK